MKHNEEEEEQLQFPIGFRRVQMYAEFLMGGLSGVILLLYLDRKYSQVLPPALRTFTDTTAFIALLICTMFAGAKALFRIANTLREIRTLIQAIIKYKEKEDEE